MFTTRSKPADDVIRRVVFCAGWIWYQLEPPRGQQAPPGSPPSSVASERSTESDNGSDPTDVAPARSSFEGGAAFPALGRASARAAMARASAKRTACLLRMADTAIVG